ncbi:MAG: DNRLRE domain-containing protein [Ignavibacteria bacterium]|nr:DNRLRE domain-containing protein [Ignavibacteria bacterium]
MKARNFLLPIILALLISGAASGQNVISIRLGPETGQDCNIASYIPDTPLPLYPDMVAAAWTYQGEFNLWRPLFKFNLRGVPARAQIQSARLSLFGNPYPVSALHSGANKSYIRRVTSAWDHNSVTWETQPDFSTVDQVELPQSTSPVQDYPNIDVTDLVREMLRDSTTNFGFVIMNRTENIYRSMNFASSDCIDSTKRPLLVISYMPNPQTGTAPLTNVTPKDYDLSQNFPNPFNPVTIINFDIPVSAFVSIKIFDQLGREVSTVTNENLKAGSYNAQWDGSNFGSGTYFIRLESGSKVITRKMLLVK